jgi:sterol 3beta-glucosyltransferase
MQWPPHGTAKIPLQLKPGSVISRKRQEMHITLVTIGTRGDVQPMVALGRGLQRAGHTVQVVADRTFESLVRSNQLEYAPLNADPRQAMQADIRKLGGNPLALLRWVNEQYQPLARQGLLDVQAASAGTDAILHSSLAFIAYHVAESRRLPTLPLYLQPFTPSRAYNVYAPGLPGWLPFKGTVNWWTAHLSNLLFFRMVYSSINTLREELLGLKPVPWHVYARLDTSQRPILYGYSPAIVPKPPDWGNWLHVTGSWFLDADPIWQPPESLLRFLESGPPPVYVGFGSTIDQDAEAMTRLVVAALSRAGQRGILLGGWSDLGSAGLPETIYRTEYVPHEWLFPQMAAVVHHGGAGTTTAGLRAGVPNVVVPYFADQAFWGWQVYKLGAGPAPILRKHLTADKLAAAIQQSVRNKGMRSAAAITGDHIRAEKGVETAVGWVEHYLLADPLIITPS